MISASEIASRLNTPYEIEVYSELPSTNVFLKERLKTDKKNYLILAERQTAGKGTKGRTFFSPDGTGVYMSFSLFPNREDGARLTTIAAVAVAEAAEAACGETVGIKWVNDIILHGKKVCGILTEGGIKPDGAFDYAVVGVGINVFSPTEGFPADLASVATALLPTYRDGARERLIADILNRFFAYLALPASVYRKKYKERSVLLNKEVVVRETEKYGTVTDIDDECKLHVRYRDGEEDVLSAGEVSVRVGE